MEEGKFTRCKADTSKPLLTSPLLTILTTTTLQHWWIGPTVITRLKNGNPASETIQKPSEITLQLVASITTEPWPCSLVKSRAERSPICKSAWSWTQTMNLLQMYYQAYIWPERTMKKLRSCSVRCSANAQNNQARLLFGTILRMLRSTTVTSNQLYRTIRM